MRLRRFYFPAALGVKNEMEKLMSEPETLPTETTSTPAVAPPAEAQKPEPATADHMIPKTRFDQVNTELKQLKAELEKAAKERQTAEANALAERGQYKELYEKEQKAASEALAKLRQLEFDGMRREIATTAGHPQLWNRLQGATKEELEADMNALAALIPKTPAPTLNGGAGAGKRNDGKATLTDEQIKEQAARYGVDFNLLKQQYLGA